MQIIPERLQEHCHASDCLCFEVHIMPGQILCNLFLPHIVKLCLLQIQFYCWQKINNDAVIIQIIFSSISLNVPHISNILNQNLL
jgi:hypothetical protein